MTSSNIGLYEAYGIEIELMIVDKETLNVRPDADKLLTAAAGELVSDFEDGPITWSNELVSHVIEFKTTGPSKTLSDLEQKFYESQCHAAHLLNKIGSQLMPTGMHPWMNPLTETKLWPHDNNEIYSLYNSIFDCRGHGWSNLQSVHINLPFKNESEFKRLHAAIRLVLPLIPALGASSPFFDGKLSANRDSRLAFYETNQQRIPIIAGDVIPPAISGFQHYRKQITEPIQLAVAPFDKNRILAGDWLNSRGAIARIDRGSIEIRLLDTQECPRADLAVVQFIIALVKSFTEDDQLLARADAIATLDLQAVYKTCVSDADTAVIQNTEFLKLFNDRKNQRELDSATASDLLKSLFETRIESQPHAVQFLEESNDLISRPTLATRITMSAGEEPSRARICEVYSKLCDCLNKNKIFAPDDDPSLQFLSKNKTGSSASEFRIQSER